MSAWWLVPGDGRALRYPERCACCDAETTERWDVVPYCSACRKHIPFFGPLLRAILTAAAGFGAMYGMYEALPFAPFGLHLAAVAVAAFAIPLSFRLLARVRTLGAAHVDRLQAAELTNSGLLVRSKAWAERVAELNGTTARSVSASKFAIAERLLPYVAALATSFSLAWIYPEWHFRLWIDNGTASPVTVRVDGNSVAEVAAGEKTRVELPAIARYVTTSAGDSELIDGKRAPTWVLNVARKHCYVLHSQHYSQGGGLDLFPTAEPERFDGGLFAVDASWFFQPPPQTIMVKKSEVIGSIPTPRSALEIVPCTKD